MYQINTKERQLLNDGEVIKCFLSDETLKDPKYSLYAYASVKDGELYVKFGEAKKQTVYDRYATITGHDAAKQMIEVWKSDKGDKIILNFLKRLAKNRHYDHVVSKGDVTNTVESFKIVAPQGLNDLLNDISELAEDTGVIEKTYRKDYPNIVSLVDEIIKYNKEKYNLDLCARWGKTSTILRLSQKYNIEEDVQLFIMGSYVSTVKTSYSNEIIKFSNNDRCMFIDPDQYDNDKEIISKIKDWTKTPGNYVMYYVALTGDEKSCFKRRTDLLKKLNLNSVMYVEEVDFGSTCDKQVAKIRNLYNSLNCKHFISMTGTNAEKAERIFEPEITIKRDYLLDVLNERPQAVGIDWAVLNNSNMVNVIGYDKAEMENFSDMFEVEDGKLKGEDWFEQFFQFLFNNNFPVTKATRKYAKAKLLTEGATMIFTPTGNEGHAALKKLLQKVCGNAYAIRVLDGTETSNENCEWEAMEAIKTYGTNVIFIASAMANRSFSIPKIKNIVLLTNGASDASVVQKISRGLTPWDDKHKTCHIIDVRLDYAQSNLSKYLSDMACDTLGETSHYNVDDVLETIHNLSTGHTVNSVLNIIDSTPKLALYEYFTNDVEPFIPLTRDKLKLMLHSSTYNRQRAYSVVYKVLDTLTVRKEFAKALTDERLFTGLMSTNVKGDSVKRIATKLAAKTKGSGILVEDIEKNPVIQHLAFLLNHFDIFVTGKFESNLLENEFNSFTKADKEHYETIFNIDMELICNIAKILIKSGVNLDGEVSLH